MNTCNMSNFLKFNVVRLFECIEFFGMCPVEWLGVSLMNDVYDKIFHQWIMYTCCMFEIL